MMPAPKAPLGSRRNVWTSDMEKRLAEMWSDGKTGAQIAEDLGKGLTAGGVFARARNLGLPNRFRKGSKKNPSKRPRFYGGFIPGMKHRLSEPPKLRAYKARAGAWDALPGTDPVAIEDVSGCRWPVGDEYPFTFCNEPIFRAHYCEAHHKLSRAKDGDSGREKPASTIASDSLFGETLSSDGAVGFGPSSPVAANEAAALPGGPPSSTRAIGAPA